MIDDKARAEAIVRTLEMFSRPVGFRNRLVAALEDLVPLDPFPACATCPAGFWFYDDRLRCFCTVKKDSTWGPLATPVRACSEREVLLTPPQKRAEQGL